MNKNTEILLINRDDATVPLKDAIAYVELARELTNKEYNAVIALAAMTYVKKAKEMIEEEFGMRKLKD